MNHQNCPFLLFPDVLKKDKGLKCIQEKFAPKTNFDLKNLIHLLLYTV